MSAAGGTGASGSGGTTSQDGGGHAGSSMAGSGGMNGSGGRGVRDAAPDADASRSDASDAASDAERRCVEPTRIQDAGSCTLSICRRGATVEISATHSSGWLVGALFWTLAVCDMSFTRSRSPGGDIRTLIYDVPEADWARMRDGDPVFMYYGTPATSSAATPCGQLTKNIPNCPP
jgi:hypothetical protein